MSDYNLVYSHQIERLPESDTAIIVLKEISMYLTNSELHQALKLLQEKYKIVHILMDIYTVPCANESKYKNTINKIVIILVYRIGDIPGLLDRFKKQIKQKYFITPKYLVDEILKLW